MTPEAINRLDIYMRCRIQARELSNKSLALKFDVNERTIIKALRNGSSKGLTADDIKLIYNYQSERDRLKSIAAEHSPNVLLREGLAEATEMQKYLEGERDMKFSFPEPPIITEVGEQVPEQTIQRHIFVDDSDQPVSIRLEADEILEIKGTDVYVDGIRKCSLRPQKTP